MDETPPPPPHQDWQSPEFGEAIRVILDVHAGVGQPQPEIERRFARLGQLVQTQPEVTVGAFLALINAALGLPALLPTTWPGGVQSIREQLERKVYEDINEMPPPQPE